MSSTDRAITSGQQVLIPDRPRSKKIERKTVLVVNSRDRNILGSTGTNSFRYNLRRPLKDIVSVEMINAAIPGYILNINTGWNKFTFQEGSTQYTVTLTPGSYTASQLCTELQTQLNALSGIANTYTVALGPRNQRMTISRAALDTTSFSLLFYSGVYVDELDQVAVQIRSINCPARFFGFGFNDYTSDANGEILAPVAMDVENFLTRAYLHINLESNIELNRMELSAGRHDCYHIFMLHPGQEDYVFSNKDTELSLPIFFAFPAPLARISFLDISIRDEFYRLLDLQNREVNLVFEITHLE
jgi:hypothetical protein